MKGELRYCARCGHALVGAGAFCGSCGSAIPRPRAAGRWSLWVVIAGVLFVGALGGALALSMASRPDSGGEAAADPSSPSGAPESTTIAVIEPTPLAVSIPAVVIREGVPVPAVVVILTRTAASVEWRNDSPAAVVLSVPAPEGLWIPTLNPGETVSLEVGGWPVGTVRYLVSSGAEISVGYLDLTMGGTGSR